MNDKEDKKDKKDFIIILWSSEEIKIDNVELKQSIQSDAPDAKVQIANLKDIKEMDLKRLRSFLDKYSEKSALIVSPAKEELGKVDFWKLGFVMGKMSIKGKDKAPIIVFLKGNKNSLDDIFDDIRECFTTHDTEIGIKGELKSLMEGMNIHTEFDLREFKVGKKFSEKEKGI